MTPTTRLGYVFVKRDPTRRALGLRELHRKKLQPDSGEPSDAKPLWKPSGHTPSDQRAISFYVAQTAWGRERVARRARETSLRDVVYGLLNAAFLAGAQRPVVAVETGP